MTLTFVGHSTYLVDTGHAYLLFDYYKDFSLGCRVSDLLTRPSDPLYIFCTHSHGDHYSDQVFALETSRRKVYYLFHNEVESTVPIEMRSKVQFVQTEEPFVIDALVSGRAYGSTDLGGSIYVEIKSPKTGKVWKVFHAGDLNNWHWNEEADEYHINLYERAYEVELKRFETFPISLDLAMFPTDYRLGRDYLKGLDQFLNRVKCRYIAPMHLNGEPRNDKALRSLALKHSASLLYPEYEGQQHQISPQP